MALDSLQHKAVILAGGKGARFYPLTKEIPKPLIPAAGKPIINYLVDLLFNKGRVEEIFILIPQSFSDEFYWWRNRYFPNKNISFFEEKEPLGTFGGLWHLKDKLSGGDFFMTNADEIKDLDLSKMMDFHKNKGLFGTLALVKVPNPQDYGVVLCENGLVKSFLEKPENPPSDFISSGLYILSPKIFDYHPGPKYSMIEKELFPKLAELGKLAGFQFNGDWFDCGTWERYEKALECLRKKQNGEKPW